MATWVAGKETVLKMPFLCLKPGSGRSGMNGNGWLAYFWMLNPYHPKQLIHYLTHLQYPAYLVGIIESFLDNCHTNIHMDDFTSAPFQIGIGLPQGSPLSVILYIIYKNLLLIKNFNMEDDCVSIGYVEYVVHLVVVRLPE